MVAFGHTAIGAGVGVITYKLYGHSDPTIGLLAAGGYGVISHYVADFIPHGHFAKKLNKGNVLFVVLFDLFLSIALFLGGFLKYKGFSLELLFVLFGMGGSLLPDVIDSLMTLKVLPKKGFLKIEQSFHQAIHWHGTYQKALGIGWYDIWQVAVVILAFYLMITLK